MSHGLWPLFNGRHTFFTGALDQSWWPDGQYTAPTDDALEGDLLEVKRMGFNMLRLHQKVNPDGTLVGSIVGSTLNAAAGLGR